MEINKILIKYKLRLNYKGMYNFCIFCYQIFKIIKCSYNDQYEEDIKDDLTNDILPTKIDKILNNDFNYKAKLINKTFELYKKGAYLLEQTKKLHENNIKLNQELINFDKTTLNIFSKAISHVLNHFYNKNSDDNSFEEECLKYNSFINEVFNVKAAYLKESINKVYSYGKKCNLKNISYLQNNVNITDKFNNDNTLNINFNSSDNYSSFKDKTFDQLNEVKMKLEANFEKGLVKTNDLENLVKLSLSNIHVGEVLYYMNVATNVILNSEAIIVFINAWVDCIKNDLSVMFLGKKYFLEALEKEKQEIEIFKQKIIDFNIVLLETLIKFYV
ncbi:hypothetical protein EHP00_1313 [Ecytonucleospora hepatopenaei]|uniref:Uncharacterized protein n=1 Tax=Ecytonucleospora hepatopenaei TaxID=646526 RepID=A0A1W0E5D5_9MICR|nr:hypothetical protein EHP00_1313 [Ecytonucleospora hepatopenaei]